MGVFWGEAGFGLRWKAFLWASEQNLRGWPRPEDSMGAPQ